MLHKDAWLEGARLWLVLDRHAAAPRALQDVARLCLSGGVDAVVCRIKDLPQEEVRALSLPVREVCAARGAPFIASHDVELALELGADGIQLGLGDPPLAEVRARLGQGAAIGCSTHAVAEAAARLEEGADYVFLGPVFPTPAKLKYGAPLGLGVVAEAAHLLAKPVVCIGGITPDNVGQVIEAGIRRVAALAALQAQPDPRVVALRFKRALDV
jgi:thiamine-phosphate pyrophosphorylase